jgi:hypothetical protein
VRRRGCRRREAVVSARQRRAGGRASLSARRDGLQEVERRAHGVRDVVDRARWLMLSMLRLMLSMLRLMLSMLRLMLSMLRLMLSMGRLLALAMGRVVHESAGARHGSWESRGIMDHGAAVRR